MPAIITIKIKGKIKAAEGKSVSKGEILAEEEFIPQLISLNIAKFLAVKPKKCLEFLVKKPGDKVGTSDALASKKNFFGLRKKIIKAPCEGIVERLEAETGELVISLPKEKKAIKSPVSGKVKKVGQGEIVISISGEEIRLKEVVGSYCQGELFLINKEKVDLYSLNKMLSGKIVCGKTWSLPTLEKARALGAAAILGTEFFDLDFEREKNGKRLIIGEKEEKLIFNFGLIENEDFKILEKNQGKPALFVPREKKVIILNK